MIDRSTTNFRTRPLALPLLGILLLFPGSKMVAGEREVPFERTEERVDCRSYDSRRQPFFGATHLHTGLSFDASIRFVKPRPLDAYRFAQGKAPIQLVGPAGNVRWEVKLDRPLDWGAVTDHSEHFGEMGICKDEGEEKPKGYNSLECQLIRGFYWQPGVGQPPSLQRENASTAFGILVLPNERVPVGSPLPRRG